MKKTLVKFYDKKNKLHHERVYNQSIHQCMETIEKTVGCFEIIIVNSNNYIIWHKSGYKTELLEIGS